LKTKHAKLNRAVRARDNATTHGLPERFLLRLYVAGATTRSREALHRICQLCDAELKDNYELEVIDVYQQPELARQNQIVATPTLIREAPAPMRRFIGDLVNIAGLFDDLSAIAPGHIGL
jgi:circadian clock protein KaiB